MAGGREPNEGRSRRHTIVLANNKTAITISEPPSEYKNR